MTDSYDKVKKLIRIVDMVNNSDIASIKQSITQIINIINDPESGAKDLKDSIELDPPLSAKVLKLANSALYGYPRTISEIQEAIICIGFEAVKELALSQKISELFAKEKIINGYSRISLWKHSVAIAICSKLVYRREFRERGENAYAAGLLHDIGITVIDQFLPSVFRKVIDEYTDKKNSLHSTETNILGYNHADIGMAIAKNWQFPDELIAGLGYHHNPGEAEDETAKIAYIIAASEYICQSKNIGFVEDYSQNKKLFRTYLDKLDMKEKALELIVEEVEEETKKMEKAGWF